MKINLENHNINHANSITDVRSQLEHHIQIHETKESGWIFDKINSMKMTFYKSEELDGSGYVKVPLRSSALINSKTMINIVSFGQF